MPDRLPLTLSVISLAWLAASESALADIYNWVDASGTVTASNIAPPEGVRVTRVVHTSAASAKAAAAAADAARAAQLRELTERVRELEQEVQSAKQAPPPDFAYPPMMPPPAPYAASRAPAAPQYIVVEQPAPSANYGCDPAWASCWSSFGLPWSYPVVVVSGSGHRHHAHRGGGHGTSRHGGGPQRRMQPKAVARGR